MCVNCVKAILVDFLAYLADILIINFPKLSAPAITTEPHFCYQECGFLFFASISASFYYRNYIVKQVEKYPQYPFKKARLVNANKPVSTRWYIEFWLWDINQKKLIRKRDYQLNQFKTPGKRKDFAAHRIKSINQILSEGVYIDTNADIIKVPEIQSFDTKLSDALVYILAIKKAESRLSTYQNYLSCYKISVEYFKEKGLINYMANSIRKTHILSFLDWLITNRSINNQTRNNYLGKLSSMFEMMKEREIIQQNPCKGIPKLKTEIGKNIAFTTEQAKQLKVIISSLNPELWSFIQFMFYGFIRPNEIRQLKVKHIDLVNDRIMIPAGISKNKRTAFVKLSPPFKEFIMKREIHLHNDEDFVFNKGGGVGATMIQENIMSQSHLQILRDYGFSSDYTLYSWKHTGVVHHYLAGVDIKSLQAQLRHANLQETDTYLKSLGLFDNKEIETKAPVL